MSEYSLCTSCRLCGNSDLIQILNLGDQHLGSVFPKASQNNPIKAPLVLVKCNDEDNNDMCGLLQLQHTVNNTCLYTDNYGYRSGLNNTMTKHLKSLASYVMSLTPLHASDIVVDIGCNDATLLSFFPDNVTKVGVDPCGSQFAKYHPKDIVLIPDYFSKKVFESRCGKDKKAKVVCSISMFYDLPNPLSFALDVATILADDGVWVMEQSYLPTMLEQNSFDTICHEHIEYYALKQIQWICNRTNLRIVDVSTNECNGGSFRIAIVKNTSYLETKTHVEQFMIQEQGLLLHTIDPYNAFKKRILNEKQNLMEFVEKQQKIGKTFAIYGASTKGNTLLQYYSLSKKHIQAGCAERNPIKYGCRTPGTDIPITSEEDVKQKKPDFMIVLPWHFKKEFLVREKDYLEAGGKLVFRLPTFQVV